MEGRHRQDQRKAAEPDWKNWQGFKSGQNYHQCKLDTSSVKLMIILLSFQLATKQLKRKLIYIVRCLKKSQLYLNITILKMKREQQYET